MSNIIIPNQPLKVNFLPVVTFAWGKKINLAVAIAVPTAAKLMATSCQGNKFFIVNAFTPKPDNKGNPEMEKLAMTIAIQRELGMIATVIFLSFG
jgi:hypothetical protein